MASLVSSRYAEALFQLASESNRLDQYFEQISAIFEIFHNDKDLVKFFNHPQITGAEKLSVIDKSFKDMVNEDILGLFKLVLRKNREAFLPEILEAFIEKTKAHKGMAEAKVVSAVELTEAQIQDIKTKLSNKLNKQVTITTEVDKTLIGGMRVNVCGQVFDSTIKTHLQSMKQQLLDVRLA